MSVEVSENVAPVIFWRKELRDGSGGAGRTRGGLGQIMEIAGQDDLSFACNASFDRVANPPRGRAGGLDGAAGYVGLRSGGVLRTKGFQTIPDGDRLVLKLPGGGGMGDPRERDPKQVAADVRDGFITREEAKLIYGVMLTEDGLPDSTAP
jgi:N-methylhydantoinase B